MSQDVKKLLIVDDDEAILSFFQEIFPRKLYRVECVSDGEEAIRMVEDTDYDVVVTDLCMPKMDGLRLIQELHKIDPTTTVVAITGFGTIKDAVSLMKTGAYDVLTKPFSLDEIRVTIDKAIRHSRLTQENRELERRLKTSEKLAVVGKLAAGVADEMQGPLDGANRFVNLALERLQGQQDVRGYLSDAREGLERISGIVRGLNDFSRSLATECSPRTVGQLVDEAVGFYENLADQHGIELIVGHDDESVAVPGSFVHVMSNLIKNAIDAIDARDDGGRIVVTTERTDGGTLITVSDDGPGIPEDVRTKVFEPFFTTKKPGAGTGLGLSICEQIVERQNSRISFESTDRGTVFSIVVPHEADDEVDGSSAEEKANPVAASPA